MTKCKGKTKTGKKCNSSATQEGYCRWHHEPYECIVCLDKLEEKDGPLPCGHIVHRSCVQKAADAMQDLRAEDGYPPIKECLCPVCRTVVEGLKPKEVPSAEAPLLIEITLNGNELNTAIRNWIVSGGIVSLSWYIWRALREKYPSYNSDELIFFAQLIAPEILRFLIVQ
uniref:Putative RING finger E3 ubiquitin ligase n=1 Tax=Marseillevirus LCMAC201 TaxID=2506605 RepID=A0A481YX82_9VIRU|nr:MAG: putative RING finger E3 ubiquitin ligase [Marseillevirus LCMAC201]